MDRAGAGILVENDHTSVTELCHDILRDGKHGCFKLEGEPPSLCTKSRFPSIRSAST